MVKIVPLKGLLQSETVLEDMCDIFFANAATQEFASADARIDYFDFWFRRYIHFFLEATFVAQPEDGAAIGYLVGSLVSNQPPVPGPDYYELFPDRLTRTYPAHLHVNVRSDARGQGIGSELIEAFRAACLLRQIQGMHAVTTADSRAARFFRQCGLEERARANWRGRSIAFLGEPLMIKSQWKSRLAFRPALPQDFDYCAALYFGEMAQIIRELKLDITAQTASFQRQWQAAEVRIITLDSADIGWLQASPRDDALFLCQFFVEAAFQRRGIGTEIMTRLIGEAANEHRAMTLEVVKSNPALRLYERLGFRTIGADERKFHMRREAGSLPSSEADGS